MIKYIIGAVAGGLLGYLVLHKVIGCSTGSCPISANPYVSTIYGIVLGLLIAGIITLPAKQTTQNTQSTPVNQTTQNTQSTASTYKKITAEEAKARMDSGDNIIVVDVRTEAEYDSGHIPNAILIPNETISDTKPALLPELNAEILVYCRSGNRSAQAARKLIAMGYTNVSDFGGIIDWPYETTK